VPTPPTGSSPAPPRRSRLRTFAALLATACALVFGLLAALPGPRWLVSLGRLGLGAIGILLLGLLFRVAWRRLLWRVGRRLAFSYALVGLLPLALVALLGLLAAYLAAGVLLGHLSRDSLAAYAAGLERAASAELVAALSVEPPVLEGLRYHRALYHRGRRVSGDERAPALWPAWLDSPGEDADGPSGPHLVALDEGTVGAAAVAGSSQDGLLLWDSGDLAADLRLRNRSWAAFLRRDDPRAAPTFSIALFGRDVVVRGLWHPRDPAELTEFYRASLSAPEEEPGWLDRPLVSWIERTGELRTLAGEPTGIELALVVAGSPRATFRSLLAGARPTDSTGWIALAGAAVLLFEIWVVAGAVAMFMIVGLSRAVNRLSRATTAIARGDFSHRIPARRGDQVGDLQRSFNEMAGHLDELVETAAQKEAIDKELDLARGVQRDLLPDLIAPRAGVDLATTFEPSSAIGGDYYDVLERPGGRMAVVVADVAGHGLAAGLRMAMVKSALSLLVADPVPSGKILERLSRLLRAGGGERTLVTLTLAELDPQSGELAITNAGHPPTYVVRGDGSVEEITLPSLPLGSLPGAPAERSVRLAAHDAVVWVSDGIPEGRSPAGDPYGYERLAAALTGRFGSAAELRERLLADLRRHTGDAPIDDDRTLVVLRYTPPSDASPSTS